MPEKGPHPDSKLAAWYFIKAFMHKLERNSLLVRQRRRMLQVSNRNCLDFHNDCKVILHISSHLKFWKVYSFEFVRLMFWSEMVSEMWRAYYSLCSIIHRSIYSSESLDVSHHVSALKRRRLLMTALYQV
ncbi:hypothetical protein Peur_008012 [Populus x canadensis]